MYGEISYETVAKFPLSCIGYLQIDGLNAAEYAQYASTNNI